MSLPGLPLTFYVAHFVSSPKKISCMGCLFNNKPVQMAGLAMLLPSNYQFNPHILRLSPLSPAENNYYFASES
jgi:hypothetical protein